MSEPMTTSVPEIVSKKSLAAIDPPQIAIPQTMAPIKASTPRIFRRIDTHFRNWLPDSSESIQVTISRKYFKVYPPKMLVFSVDIE